MKRWLAVVAGGFGLAAYLRRRRRRRALPAEPERRGCALSIAVRGGGRDLLERLRLSGVVCDFRVPNVIRAAPVPLYNTFEDVLRFAGVLKREAGRS